MHRVWSFIKDDWIGLGINLYFGVMLIPVLFDPQKPPLLTCVPTGIGLIILGFAGSYRSKVTSAAVIGVGIIWLLIGWQRWQQG